MHHAVGPMPSGRSWREQAAVVLAVGMRPCSGALVVLVFALSQGVLAAGMAAVVLMGLALPSPSPSSQRWQSPGRDSPCALPVPTGPRPERWRGGRVAGSHRRIGLRRDAGHRQPLSRKRDPSTPCGGAARDYGAARQQPWNTGPDVQSASSRPSRHPAPKVGVLLLNLGHRTPPISGACGAISRNSCPIRA